jgi:hypothetical protein
VKWANSAEILEQCSDQVLTEGATATERGLLLIMTAAAAASSHGINVCQPFMIKYLMPAGKLNVDLVLLQN